MIQSLSILLNSGKSSSSPKVVNISSITDFFKGEPELMDIYSANQHGNDRD